MEWWTFLIIYFGSFIVLMSFGMPIVFAFLLVTMTGVWIFWGGGIGLEQFMLSLYSALATFTMLPLLLFILMGEVTFRSGVGIKMIDAVNIWMGKLPGRLSLVAVLGGVLLSSMSGSSLASTAILGSTLVPEMEKRGYKKPMTLGPILGSGGIAIMVPPSALAILVATLGVIPIGRFLIAIIVPALIMSAFYAGYIIIRCTLQPSLAASYDVETSSWSKKLRCLVYDILPLAIVVFLVIGVIILGIATPSEAAATGTLGIFILAAINKKLNWDVLKQSLGGSLRSAGMILLIISSSIGYSQILAFSGATNGMIEFAVNLPVSPLLIIVAMQVVVLILGCFMSAVAVMMIAIPLFMPIVVDLGFDTLWFGVMFLLNMEMAQTTPPYGTSLFVMKAVAPKDTTMWDIYKAALPFLLLDALTMILILLFPRIATWLPDVMK